MANLAILAELSQQQEEHEKNEQVGESFMDKKVKDLTKSLQTIAESCKLAAMPEAPEEESECTIIDAFSSLILNCPRLESLLEEKIKKRATQNA